MGRIVRYIIFLVVILVFLAATAVTVTSGGSVGVVLAALVAAVLTLPQNLEWFWDRLGPARNLRPTVRDTQTEPGTIEEYLNGKLREFADEERRFVPLALAITPAYQEAEGEPTEDIARLFRVNSGRLALIGDPGAGKSTTLRHLMRQAIADYKANPETSRIPVWINLGEGANPLDGDELLEHWWDKRCFLPGDPERFVRQHRLLLFLDGLNEMPLDTRDQRAAALRAWLTQNAEVQVVVTCRVRDYEDDEALKLPLPAVRVLPLDDERVQDFIQRNGGDTALWPLINASDALRALAANPYNLYQLVQIYAENQRAGNPEALPSDLNALYRRYIEVAYARYTRERTAKRDAETPLLRLPLPRLEARLKRLAFALLAGGKGTSADLEWALHWRRRWRWGQQAIIDGLNLGVLLGDGQNLRFYHQSLYGYYYIKPVSRALNGRRRLDRFTVNRVALIRQIGELGSAGMPAVRPLLWSLTADEDDVRLSASDALQRLGSSAVVSLIQILADVSEDAAVRHNAEITLNKLGTNAIEPLIQSLTNTDADVRNAAAAALRKIGSPAVEPLIQSLHKIGSPGVEVLIQTLGNTDWYVRSRGLDALIKTGTPAVGPLIRALDDQDSYVRRVATDALGKLNDARALDPLCRTLEDGIVDVRLGAASALAKIGDAHAVEPLIRVLRDVNARVRQKAVITLGMIGDTRAVEPLMRKLYDDDPVVRASAADALERIGTPEAMAVVQAWRKNLTP